MAAVGGGVAQGACGTTRSAARSSRQLRWPIAGQSILCKMQVLCTASLAVPSVTLPPGLLQLTREKSAPAIELVGAPNSRLQPRSGQLTCQPSRAKQQQLWGSSIRCAAAQSSQDSYHVSTATVVDSDAQPYYKGLGSQHTNGVSSHTLPAVAAAAASASVILPHAHLIRQESLGSDTGLAAAAEVQQAGPAALNNTTAVSDPISDPSSVPPPQPEASTSASSPSTPQQRVSNLAKRVASGIVLGLTGAGVLVTGHYVFLALILFVVFHATQEYYGLLVAKDVSEGRDPPPPLISALTTVLCLGIALMSFNKAKSGTILAVSAFCLMVLEVVAAKRPKFAQLASSVFGLFYCGWLPSFWIKLRNYPLAAPDSPLVSSLLAGLGVRWTVGLLATFTTVACIIAADTGAYFVGKNFGRTKLTDISPKKTREGALGGLVSSVVVALGVWRGAGWPPTWQAAVGLGIVTFFSSLFGDLIESIMKRDAGVKDSGDLIPGHGGLLDRFDSYMFSGAVTYFYLVFCLPWFGVAPVVALV